MRYRHLLIVCPLVLSGCGGCGGSGSSPDDGGNRVPTLKDIAKDLKSPSEETRWAAAFALGNKGVDAKPELPALGAALNDSSPRVRAEVAWALVHVDPQGDEVLQELMAAL